MNLIIADATLQDLRGHSFEYCRALHEAAEKRGYRCSTLARNCVSEDIAREIGAIPCFCYGVEHAFRLPIPTRRLRARWNQWVHGRMMFRDLKEAESGIELDAHSVVIAPTVYCNQIIPFVNWAEQIPPHQQPRFVLVFHSSAYPEFTDSDYWEQLYRRAFRRLERSKARRNFSLFTDSDELVDEFQSYSSLPFHRLPIPHAQGVAGIRALPARRANGTQPIRLTQLGYSNGLNKGFQHFAPLFHQLRPYFESGQIVAELQASISTNTWQQIQTSLRRLREMPYVTLHEEPLGTEAYYGILERAGIVVLPYNTVTYHSQTSGVFSEAVAYGKPVIVPRGTWMARQLRDHAAGVTFIADDLQSMYEAVVEAIHRYDELSECALRRADHWRRQHCVPTYLDSIFDTIGAA